MKRGDPPVTWVQILVQWFLRERLWYFDKYSEILLGEKTTAISASMRRINAAQDYATQPYALATCDS